MQINTGKALIIFLLFFLIIPCFTVGQTTTVNPDSALQKILDNLDGDDLSLSQAREYVIKNSTSIRSAEAEYLAAAGSLRRERTPVVSLPRSVKTRLSAL